MTIKNLVFWSESMIKNILAGISGGIVSTLKSLLSPKIDWSALGTHRNDIKRIYILYGKTKL